MDTILTLLVAVTQLLLGGMGVYVALKPPQPRHHSYWISAFMLVGLVGVFFTGWIAHRATSAPEKSSAKISEAITAATNANTSATNANNAATNAQKEVKEARDEAANANAKLSKLINESSTQTTSAILNLTAR